MYISVSLSKIHSKYLTKTPDFTGAPNLERLILDGCTSLSFVHPSIGLLKKLILLNLKDCKQFKSLRAKIEWESLEVLILSGCSKLSSVREIMSNTKHLATLKVLDLNGCSKLDKLPEDLGHLASLESLDLGGTAMSQPPSSIVLLKNLEQLSFHGCKGKARKSWSSLSSLFPLFPRANLESVGLRLPSSLSGLCSLRQLDLGDCNLQEGAIPSDIGFLPSLIKLNLSSNDFVSLPASISQLPQLETLSIDYCDRLQALPELPASTDGLYARNCTSLEIISSSPSHIFKSTPRMFYFNNCFRLAGSRRTHGVTVTFFKNLLHSLLKSQVQGLKCGVTRSDFEIIVPGSQVPDWFIHQSEGSSISISQPMPTCSGLALCAAFSVHHPKGFYQDQWMNLRCHLEVNFTTTDAVSKTLLDNPRTVAVSMSVPLQTLAGTDHLWLFYISRSYLTYNDFFYLSMVSFRDESHEGFTIKVKECGLRPVYDSDVEEFIRASNNLSSNTRPEVLDPDRLAVTSTIIKRSCDYCSDQQPYPKRLK
ncbi:TMV resistance protein N-like [Pistacia vera]|uniref:TMV resistance protein N-like n=1 Tax=Pistacia vera TaxID=55513 RepID=UPI001262EDBA|nr:TMV resistance protein N-like [Pistacia vera]